MSSFRVRYAAASVARGIPAHITLLIPFVPAAQLDEAEVESAREHFGALALFDAQLVAVGRFDEHVWLALSPNDKFVELIRATCRWYPESPYGTEFPEPVPHLTVGQASDEITVEAILCAAQAELAPHLPLRFRAEAATLFLEQANRTWQQVAVLPFGQ